MTTVTSTVRDIRLDLFRGIALWFIFLDHIPGHAIAQLTIRNFGFSDATEIFVFISGYTAALVYGKKLDAAGFAASSWQVLRRVWQLYIAHILLFIIYIAQISWIAERYNNPVLLDALNVNRFLLSPGQSLVEALTLQYRPVNLDILPLYMALLLFFPVVLWLIERSPLLALGGSLTLYGVVQWFKVAFPVYEDGSTWYFNPLGWQLLFVLGALLARSPQFSVLSRWRGWLAGLAAGFLVFSLLIVLSWKNPELASWVPRWLANLIYPIDKTNMGPMRLLHFLAIAYLISNWLGKTHSCLQWRIWRPAILCGQHSLQVFCVGISLSFLAYFVLVQFGRNLGLQVAIAIAGLIIMTALARALEAVRQPVIQAKT
ncbi:MAG: OpgC family protein [Burkholderiaceae bacterium]